MMDDRLVYVSAIIRALGDPQTPRNYHGLDALTTH